MPEKCYLGVDLGGTTMKAAVADGAGKVLADERAPSGSQEGPDGGIARLAVFTGLASWIPNFLA